MHSRTCVGVFVVCLDKILYSLILYYFQNSAEIVTRTKTSFILKIYNTQFALFNGISVYVYNIVEYI